MVTVAGRYQYNMGSRDKGDEGTVGGHVPMGKLAPYLPWTMCVLKETYWTSLHNNTYDW